MINFAIIGCGRIAQRQAEHISKKVILVAICDSVAEKADAIVAKYKAKAYFSFICYLGRRKRLLEIVFNRVSIETAIYHPKALPNLNCNSY